MAMLVNKFTVVGNPDEFERIWQASSEFMRHQPGFVSFRLVRSVREPQVYFNIAEWADVAAHEWVVRSPAFQEHISELAKVAKPEPSMCETVISHGSAA
ncbi:MAG TPA: antibiotic biosynthesis monooxygenase family protein [Pseudonocardiaceae bacterium]|jgi:long-chain acyl-CoA synthetase|nr:antibiotic biosynthesis monooxygenase family protein [Pseudonocardiaceae bacterium]